MYGPVGHLSVRLLEQLRLEWQGHVFYRPRHGDDARAYAGTELDTVAHYALGEGLELGALWAYFSANGDHFDQEGTANYGEVELRFRFGP